MKAIMIIYNTVPEICIIQLGLSLGIAKINNRIEFVKLIKIEFISQIITVNRSIVGIYLVFWKCQIDIE